MSERVTLRFYRPDQQPFPMRVTLPELTGAQEMKLSGVDTGSVQQLLTDMFSGSPDTSLRADQLTASDRDALLAALHRKYWGDRIVSSLCCSGCDEFFDLTFSLSGLQRHLTENHYEWSLSGNALVLHGGNNVTIPVSAQEQAVSNLARADALVELAKSIGINAEGIEQAAEQLEKIAPIIDLELDASCPECATLHKAAFDIQTFVLQRLINERELLLAEIHLIASAYGWSLTEILALPRDTRKSMARMIDHVH